MLVPGVLQSESVTYIYVHSVLDSVPVEIIAEHYMEPPMLCGSSFLFIYIVSGSVCLSTPISSLSCPYPSPLPLPAFLPGSQSCFSASVTLLFKWDELEVRERI